MSAKFITNSALPGTIPVENCRHNKARSRIGNAGGQTYQADKWSVTLTENGISNGVINRQYIQCTAGCPLPTSFIPHRPEPYQLALYLSARHL